MFRSDATLGLISSACPEKKLFLIEISLCPITEDKVNLENFVRKYYLENYGEKQFLPNNNTI